MGPPPALFSYLGAGQSFPAGILSAAATPVTHLRVPFGPFTVADWQWDVSSQRWLRSTDGQPHAAEGAGQLAFTTVIVQFVPYVATPYVDPSRTRVDQANVVGSGDAWVLADGMIVKGKWSKPDATAVTTFTDLYGHPIAIPPGRTWISLAPDGSAATTS